MDFTGDIGLWQRRVAGAPEGVARRMAAFEALGPRDGEAMVDLGCGGGHLLREIAVAVGPEGRAVGLDPSAEQLAAAGEICAGLDHAEFVHGDATATPFQDAAFDGVGSIQVLEYIADVDAALAEARRILKRGGKAALISVLWDHFQFHGADPALSARMMEAWRAHCPHQMLPLELPRRLAAAGFGAVARRPLPVFNGALHQNSCGFWIARVVARFGQSQGLDEAETAAWLDQLDRADQEGRYGFVSLPVLTTAAAI